jgi:hypothetical protein
MVKGARDTYVKVFFEGLHISLSFLRYFIIIIIFIMDILFDTAF